MKLQKIEHWVQCWRMMDLQYSAFWAYAIFFGLSSKTALYRYRIRLEIEVSILTSTVTHHGSLVFHPIVIFCRAARHASQRPGAIGLVEIGITVGCAPGQIRLVMCLFPV